MSERFVEKDSQKVKLEFSAVLKAILERVSG